MIKMNNRTKRKGNVVEILVLYNFYCHIIYDKQIKTTDHGQI